MENATSETRRLEGPKGIGGWLVLPIIGLVGTILLSAYNLLSGLADLSGSWTIIGERFPGLLVAIALSMILALGIIALAIYCLVILFREDRRTPSMMVTFYVFLALAAVIDAVGLYYMAAVLETPSLSEGAGVELLRAAIICAIWIPYFMNSKRVRNTFVHGG